MITTAAAALCALLAATVADHRALLTAADHMLTTIQTLAALGGLR